MNLIQFLAMKLYQGPVFINGINGTSMHSILHEHLTVRKTFSRWNLHNLSIAQKKARVDWSKEMLQIYDRSASKHVYDIVTGDKS